MIFDRYVFRAQQSLDDLAPAITTYAGAILLGVFATYSFMLGRTFFLDFCALWFRTIFYLILFRQLGIAFLASFVVSISVLPSRLLPRHSLRFLPAYLCLWTLMVRASDGRYAALNPGFSDFWTLIWGQILFVCLVLIMLFAYKGERLFFFLQFIMLTIWFLFCNDVTYSNSQIWP